MAELLRHKEVSRFMFLKRISLCGFKSFAVRVDFDFGPGVTCIVGPNGGGKSNVVDAFKWVLGEQSAHSLRGRQMLDMIFNGSATRKSSSIAQVDLTFDNTDRLLAEDRDEVTVTRRLYRSGDSEYLLNLEPVRLKDIRELFLGTGIGSHSYCVIEQGKVDSLLQANPAERRLIFEEAAGVSRYKLRRKEAQRKLERTDQNLLRVADILQEVEKRLRSIKLQAGKARNFQGYDQRLRELRSSFALSEYHRFTEALGSLQTRIDEASDESGALRAQLGRHDAESSQATVQLESLTEQINTCDNDFVRLHAEVTTLEERTDAARRRIDEQAAAEAGAGQRHAQQHERTETLTGELQEAEEQIRTLEAQKQEQHTLIDQLQAEDEVQARDLMRAQASLEDEKAGIVDLLRQTARLHNELGSLDEHQNALSSQKERLHHRDAAITEELTECVTLKAATEQRLAEIDKLIAEETARLEERKQAFAHMETTRDRLSVELASAKELRSGLISRRALLTDLERKMEGVGEAVRRLLEEKRSTEKPKKSLDTVSGMVADVIDADVVYALIVEAAIKEFDQYLVVADSEAFLSSPERFADLPGRLTAICLDRLPPAINERDFSQEPGFVARATDYVTVADEFEHLARCLLGKTIVVDTLEHALALSDDDVAGYRFVTLAGELVEPNGCISLGPPATLAGLISRRSELRDIGVQLGELETGIGTLEQQLDRTAAEVVHLHEIQQELRTAIYESHTARVEVNAQWQNLTEQVRRLTDEQPLIKGEADLLERQLAEAGRRAAASKGSIEELDEENTDREARVEGHKEQIDRLVESRTDAQQALTQARVAAGELSARRGAALQTAENARRDLRATEEARQVAADEVEACRFRIRESENQILAAGQRLAELTHQSRALEAQGLQLRRQREMLRLESEDLARRTRTDRTRLEEVETQLGELQLDLGEQRVRRDELITRVGDELSIDLGEHYASYTHEEQDWESVETEIAELRGKIERLGNVNLDAITEQAELEARLEYLSTQRNDLNQSRRQLDKLIEKLNAECEERFIKSFTVIRKNFQELFRKLFGGGKADVFLEDENDALESGIEIVARPPGKELQTITLMSGGEKSLTAIALLMSIFRAHPAPFAILDEVDAALDEANNERFNSIIRQFLDRSQFIVVTHSKRTMAIADQLYGITMQEPGVSARVSVRFDQPDSDASAVA